MVRVDFRNFYFPLQKVCQMLSVVRLNSLHSICYFHHRLLLYGLNLFFTHKLKIEVRLGHVALLPPSVQNTYFLFKNFTVVSIKKVVRFYRNALKSSTFSLQHIDKVRLTSSLVNADTKRLLGLLIEDVRFTRDCSVPSTASSPIPTAVQSEANRSNLLERLLPILTSFVQVQYHMHFLLIL